MKDGWLSELLDEKLQRKTEMNVPKTEWIDDGDNLSVKIIEKFSIIDPHSRAGGNRRWYSSEQSACMAARNWVSSQPDNNKHELYVVQIIKIVKPVHTPIRTYEVE